MGGRRSPPSVLCLSALRRAGSPRGTNAISQEALRKPQTTGVGMSASPTCDVFHLLIHFFVDVEQRGESMNKLTCAAQCSSQSDQACVTATQMGTFNTTRTRGVPRHPPESKPPTPPRQPCASTGQGAGPGGSRLLWGARRKGSQEAISMQEVTQAWCLAVASPSRAARPCRPLRAAVSVLGGGREHTAAARLPAACPSP